MARTRFDLSLDAVLAHEGGYVDHPSDPGGATNLGITRKTLARWRKVSPWWDLPKTEVKAMTRAEAAKIYRAFYWDPIKAGKLPPGLDLALFDFAVNSGPGQAVKTLQRQLGIVADELVGPLTLAAIGARAAKTGVRPMIEALCTDRMGFLRALANFVTFGRGWTSRVTAIRIAALAAVGAEQPSPTTRPSTKWSDIMAFLSGYKTYLVGAVMIVVALAKLLGVDLPALDGASGGQLILEAFAVMFLRRGIKNEIGNI